MTIIERTNSTPEIELKNNTLSITGVCTPGDPPAFFAIFKEQVDMILNASERYDLIFHFDYFNTTTSKYLLDLFRKVKQSPNRDNLVITWIYDGDDDEIFESGKLFSDLSGVAFIFKPV